MSKTDKSKTSSKKQEQSTPSTETATTTKESLTSSTGDGNDVIVKEPKKEAPQNADVASHEELECPLCGTTHDNFRYNKESEGIYCGGCGVNTDIWATSNFWAPVIKAWKKVYIPILNPAHPSTPECKATARVAGGKVLECKSTTWRHVDGKLAFCAKCGANYTGEQPEDIEDIIESLTGQIETPIFNIPKPYNKDDAKKLKRARERSK